MPTEIQLPELGENLSGGDVLDIKVAPGDEVSQGQPLVEIEAEKSTVEVPSPIAGRVARVLVKKGDSIQVGQAFCLIDGKDGEKNGKQKAPVREAVSAEAEPEPKTAARQAEIAEPAKAGGNTAEKPGTTPAPPSISSRPDNRHNRVDQETHANEDSGAMLSPGTDVQHDNADKDSRRKHDTQPSAESVVPAGPATRRLARELGVDINQVPGSAHGGRVELRSRTGEGAEFRIRLRRLPRAA